MTGQHITVCACSEIKSRGFAFVRVPHGPNALLHKRVMEKAGLKSSALRKGTKLVVDVVIQPGGRRRVTRVYRMAGKPAVPVPTAPEPALPPKPLAVGDSVEGVLKWYHHQRGYGFLAVANHPDVFFHITDVPNMLHERLVDGAIFQFRVSENYKGLTAILLHEKQPVAMSGA